MSRYFRVLFSGLLLALVCTVWPAQSVAQTAVPEEVEALVGTYTGAWAMYGLGAGGEIVKTMAWTDKMTAGEPTVADGRAFVATTDEMTFEGGNIPPFTIAGREGYRLNEDGTLGAYFIETAGKTYEMIKLGEGVAELGGLHVICTEMHDSARIDRQLIGRCGRQGDPGTFRQYTSLDDELLIAGLGPKKGHKLEDVGRESEDGFDSMEKLFKKAQHKVERKHFRDRKALMYFEKQRKKMQRQMGQDPYLDTPG